MVGASKTFLETSVPVATTLQALIKMPFTKTTASSEDIED